MSRRGRINRRNVPCSRGVARRVLDSLERAQHNREASIAAGHLDGGFRILCNEVSMLRALVVLLLVEGITEPDVVALLGALPASPASGADTSVEIH